MSIVSVGGQSLVRPELTKAIQDITAKARKQLEETGTLEGFNAEFREETGDGLITLSISSRAADLYNQSTDAESFALQWRIGSVNSGGDNLSGGSTAALSTAQDVTDFGKNLIGTTAQLQFNQGFEGSDDEIAALYNDIYGGGQSGSTLADKAAAMGRQLTDSHVEAAKVKQDAAARLVSALQDFLNDLRNPSSQQKNPGLSTSQSDEKTAANQDLKNLLIRLDIQI